MKKSTLSPILSLVFLSAGTLLPQGERSDLTERARRLHFASIVLDTHVDTTLRLKRSDWTFTRRHSPMPPDLPSVPEALGQEGHVDLPRLKEGGLNALFFGVVVRGTVTGAQAVNDALEQIAAVHKLAEELPGEIALCASAAEVRAARSDGKIAALIGLEGGHMINNSLPVLRMYRKLGVRYITLTHFYHTDWADSSGQPPAHNGLTSFGREVVREHNRIGMIIDISHVSDKTFWDVLEASSAPLIASHSSCRAIAGHVRNMSDEMIRALARKGGVIHINYNTPYLDEANMRYWSRTREREQQLARELPGTHNEVKWREQILREFGPAPKVTWEKIVDHIDHVVQIAGIDHVGLGSDFDGATMPRGMEDVSKLPKITEGLMRRGYKDADLKKVLGENTLRVMEEVDRAAARERRQ